MVEMPVVLFLVASAFLGSVAFAILLRRMDTPALKLNQMRRQGELQTEKLDETAQKQIQAIRDATIDFEMMIRQSRRLKEEMSQDLNAYQERLAVLRQDRDLLESISGELSHVAGSAKSVASQVDRLDAGLQRLAYAQEEIGTIRHGLDDLASIAERKSHEADMRLNELMGRLLQEAESNTRLLTDQTHSNVQNLRDEYQDVSYKIEEQFKQAQVLSDRVSSLNMRLDEKWNQDASRLDEKFTSQERALLDRMSSIESGLTGIRAAAVEALQTDLSRIRRDLDSFNLESISRRDEILSETRRMIDSVTERINDFDEMHLNAEQKLARISEEQKTQLKERLETLTKEWNHLEEKRLGGVEQRIKGIEAEFDRLRSDQAANLEKETHQAVEQVRAEAGEAAGLLRDARILEEEHLSRIKQDILTLREEFQERARKIDTSLLEAGRIRARVEEFGERTRDEILSSSNEIIRDMEKKAERFLDEQDEKLGRINQTIDDKISRQIVHLVDRGQFQLEELEKRTADAIKDAQERMREQIERARDDFRRMRDEVTREMEVVTAMRDDVISEVEREKSKMKGISDKLDVLGRAETLATRLDETVEILTSRLKLAEEENKKLDEYVDNFEAVRIGRRELEAELRNLQLQKDRIEETQRMIGAIHEQSREIKERYGELENSEEIADRLEERMNSLVEMQADFEKSYAEIAEKKKLLEQTIRLMENSKKQAAEAKQSAEALLSRVDRAEFRQNEVDKHVEGMEVRVVKLNKLEKDIDKVESRFMQMEGLMTDLEEKQKQIGSMFRKMEEIQTHGDDMKTELESTITEADEKMEKLTAFYQTVERLVEENMDKAVEGGGREGRKSKKRAGAEAIRRESILSLHLNHKWDADLIADRLKMDAATVRAIINHA